MTRKEQIKQAARLRANQYEHPAQWSDTYYGFISGAEWADENPDKKLIYTKQELYDMGFGFTTNGNIVNPFEDIKELKKQLIDKACKWLKENKDNYAYPVYEGDTLTDECFVGESLIDNFRKAMEE